MCVLLMRVNLDYLDGFQCKHIEMKVQFILTGVRRVTIICDSIAKNISGIEGCRVQPFPGDTGDNVSGFGKHVDECLKMIVYWTVSYLLQITTTYYLFYKYFH